MKFFASWTSRDPVYQLYDPDAHILISPTGVPKSWCIDKWKTLPKELFIDSGAYTKNTNLPSVEEVLSRQIAISKSWNRKRTLFFAHPDLLLPLSVTYNQYNSLVDQSLQRAKKFLKIFKIRNIQAVPVGVLHGFDEETLIGSYNILKDIGYNQFAIGSIAIRFSQNREKCLNILEILRLYEIRPLHVFGVCIPLTDERNLFDDSIQSFDSSTPAKLGFYGTVLYGFPPKRYVIAPTAKQKMHDTFFRFRTSIKKPQPCNCPVCLDNPIRLVPYCGTKAKQDRALHNYFQLKWATETLN